VPRVTFVQPDGGRETHDADIGTSVLDCALDNQVPGLLGRCGGGCSCATCHGYFDATWLARLPAAAADELELLAYVVDARPGSRLCCQIRLTADLDGITVTLPVTQLNAT